METREEWILEQEKRKLLQDHLVTENKKKEKLGLWSKIKKSIGWN